jgi:hypothetical protein
MPRIHNQIRKSELARALAIGGTVTDWAREKNVPERTAYTWSRSPEVIDEVEAIRRDALDQAIGRLSRQVTEAAEQIILLARDAASESVRLQAARAVLAELMSVSSFAALERRMAEIERRIIAGPPSPVAGIASDLAGPFGPATGDGPVGEEDEVTPPIPPFVRGR